ncbi:MAG: hypothetical protein AAF267_20160 [Deinococcota bacterium]
MPKVSEYVKAITEARGIVTVAAESLNVSRDTFYRIINKHASVKQALESARESMKDIAENKLFENIMQGDNGSIFFYLKTQAKDRGYV